jgi:competence ComEA-like helix-hairpin-helix protein
VHTTPPARFALTCLLALVGTTTLARMGEARFACERPPPTVAMQLHGERPTTLTPTTRQGDALRDGRPIDPNLASATELELLPGVGPKLAQEIVDSRASQGPFKVLGDLRRVRGIGAKTLAKMAPLLRLAAPPGSPSEAKAQGDRESSERLEHLAHP